MEGKIVTKNTKVRDEKISEEDNILEEFLSNTRESFLKKN